MAEMLLGFLWAAGMIITPFIFLPQLRAQFSEKKEIKPLRSPRELGVYDN